MKRIYTLAFLILLTLLSVKRPVQAQTQPIIRINNLLIELWPDFDQAAVLVLIDGKLSADTPLPAFVQLPLPINATVNAVAFVDQAGDLFTIQHQVLGDMIQFEVAVPVFRIEYYQPYERVGQKTTINFTWQAPQPIEQFQVSVQQPIAAQDFKTTPTAVTERGAYGLNYHALPTNPLVKGDVYSMVVEYTIPDNAFTESLLAAEEPANPPSTAPTVIDENAQLPAELPAVPDSAEADSDKAKSWPFLLGAGVLVLGLGITWVGIQKGRTTQKSHSRPTKPKPIRTQNNAVFCPACGTQSKGPDKFCRECGANLRK